MKRVSNIIDATIREVKGKPSKYILWVGNELIMDGTEAECLDYVIEAENTAVNNGIVKAVKVAGVTYKITETLNHWKKFSLTDSTGQEESFYTVALAEEAKTIWQLEHKYRKLSLSGTAKQRAKIALAFEKIDGQNSRVYDNCFEMGDADVVAAYLTIWKEGARI